MTDLYRILKLDRSKFASVMSGYTKEKVDQDMKQKADIETEFRKLALDVHPSRLDGGDMPQLRIIQEAFFILFVNHLREMYHSSGLDYTRDFIIQSKGSQFDWHAFCEDDGSLKFAKKLEMTGEPMQQMAEEDGHESEEEEESNRETAEIEFSQRYAMAKEVPGHIDCIGARAVLIEVNNVAKHRAYTEAAALKKKGSNSQ